MLVLIFLRFIFVLCLMACTTFLQTNVPSSISLVWGPESCSGVPVLPLERRRHVHHLRPAEGQKHFGVALQPGLPLLLYLPVRLHGAVALHRPHHRLLWDHQGTSAFGLFRVRGKLWTFIDYIFKTYYDVKGSSVTGNPWEIFHSTLLTTIWLLDKCLSLPMWQMHRLKKC